MTNFNNDNPEHPITSPSHYTGRGPIEPIDFSVSNNYNFLEGSITKYLHRYPFKGNPIQDLHKAMFYLDRQIEHSKSNHGLRERPGIEVIEFVSASKYNDLESSIAFNVYCAPSAKKFLELASLKTAKETLVHLIQKQN